MKQLSFVEKTWGGKRRGAGRKSQSQSKKIKHTKRETVNLKKPLHIIQHVSEKCPSLRGRQLQEFFHKYIQLAKKKGFYVLHYALLNNHLHLLAEAEDNIALGNGMRLLYGSFARAIKALKPFTGKVFPQRYFLRVITCPTQMKNALKYILLNFCKHANVAEHIDRFCTAKYFRYWKELLGSNISALLESELQASPATSTFLSSPKSWLAAVGWMRAR